MVRRPVRRTTGKIATRAPRGLFGAPARRSCALAASVPIFPLGNTSFHGEEYMSVKRVDDVRAEAVSVGTGTTRQVLIGPDEGPHFAMRRFVIVPGGGMPAHTNTVEHEQYVLGGRATIGIGAETREVGRGDIVYIAAGTPHWYQAHAGEPFEFLCVVPNLPDTIALVDGC
jgi:quercetin dioxygenase-like cupin family protein